MNKRIFTAVAFIAGVVLVHSQGTIFISTSSPIIYTNGSAIGLGTGPAQGGTGANPAYYFEVLDMTSSAWAGLTANQQANAANLFDPSILGLWTDSGVSGKSSSLFLGGINATMSGVSAANWPSPGTSSAYGGDGQTPDYYLVVGWSADAGTSWNAVSSLLATESLSWVAPFSWFGTTTVAYNYAGGGTSVVSPPQISVWSPSSTTGLDGSGGLTGLTLYPLAPEPGPLALFSLGGLAMLLIRRRQ